MKHQEAEFFDCLDVHELVPSSSSKLSTGTAIRGDEGAPATDTTPLLQPVVATLASQPYFYTRYVDRHEEFRQANLEDQEIEKFDGTCIDRCAKCYWTLAVTAIIVGLVVVITLLMRGEAQPPF